jgi:hypothetical protein
MAAPFKCNATYMYIWRKPKTNTYAPDSIHHSCLAITATNAWSAAAFHQITVDVKQSLVQKASEQPAEQLQ